MKNQKKLIIAAIVLFIVNLAVYLYTSTGSPGVSALTSIDLSVCSKEALSDGRISLTIPSEYVYGASQDDLNKAAEAGGYESITLNENGTATYVITEDQHKQMLLDLAKGINEGLQNIPGSDEYKDVTKVSANSDFTSYEIYTSNTGADYDTSMVVMVLKMYSTMYYAFDGVSDQLIHYDFYNVNNELIATLDANINSRAQ